MTECRVDGMHQEDIANYVVEFHQQHCRAGQHRRDIQQHAPASAVGLVACSGTPGHRVRPWAAWHHVWCVQPQRSTQPCTPRPNCLSQYGDACSSVLRASRCVTCQESCHHRKPRPEKAFTAHLPEEADYVHAEQPYSRGLYPPKSGCSGSPGLCLICLPRHFDACHRMSECFAAETEADDGISSG